MPQPARRRLKRITNWSHLGSRGHGPSPAEPDVRGEGPVTQLISDLTDASGSDILSGEVDQLRAEWEVEISKRQQQWWPFSIRTGGGGGRVSAAAEADPGYVEEMCRLLVHAYVGSKEFHGKDEIIPTSAGSGMPFGRGLVPRGDNEVGRGWRPSARPRSTRPPSERVGGRFGQVRLPEKPRRAPRVEGAGEISPESNLAPW